MIINTNISALNTVRQLGINEKNTQSSLAKLSSGLRINSAADDAAGLAISEKMRGQISGLNKATSNAQDGISMVSTAEGSLNETTSILQRMRELAVQAGNDTNTTTDRTAMQTEMNALTSEVNRIGNTTEFNTQKLLKGSDVPVTTTTPASTTLAQGEAGVSQGVIGNFKMTTNSIVGSASSTTVQASSSKTAGVISTTVSQTAQSTKGVVSTLTLTNGISLQSNTTNSAVSFGKLNGMQVEIKQAISAGASTTTISQAAGNTGKVTITIGTDASGNSLATDRGTLFKELDTAVKSLAFNDANISFSVISPSGTSSAVTDVTTSGTFSGGVGEVSGAYSFALTTPMKEAGDTITIAGKTFTGVIGTADATKRQFSIGATATSTPSLSLQATDLKKALQADADISKQYTVTNTAGSLKFVENAGQASGIALKLPTLSGAGTNDTLTITNASGTNLNSVKIDQAKTVGAAVASGTSTLDTGFTLAASTKGTELNGLKIAFSGLTTGGTSGLTSSYDAKTDTLTVTGDLGTAASAATLDANIRSAVSSGLSAAGFKTGGAVTLTVGASGSAAIAGKLNGKSMTFGDTSNGGTLGVMAQANADTMSVEADSKGNLTIHLASTTASNNTAAAIQAAIQNLAKTQSSAAGDFSGFTAKSSGSWDTATLGNSLTKATATMVGGSTAQKGDYSLEIANPFKAGDIAEIAGQKFVAVDSGADATKGQFNVSGGDVNAQAAGIADAVSLNSTLSKYDTKVAGFKIELTEKVASGSDLKATDLAVKAIGTTGQFSVDTSVLNGNGGSFTIDGTAIKVSNKTANVGYSDGTAIKEATNAADQTTELANAINKNATLSQKYTATVGTDGGLVLTQNEGEETATAPIVQTTTAPQGDFSAKFQIGANSGQTMTVDIADMRSVALGISGDGSESTVAATDGSVASYVATKNISNGTDNTNVEYGLDISTADKATAAISVIDDATAAVSAERSNLGAVQNRLEHTINNLGTSSQNITTAEGNIRDVDMAKEMTAFQKNNILQQAAQSMLAQANQQGQGVLKLLQ